jgi:hypothetical protein
VINLVTSANDVVGGAPQGSGTATATISCPQAAVVSMSLSYNITYNWDWCARRAGQTRSTPVKLGSHWLLGRMGGR